MRNLFFLLAFIFVADCAVAQVKRSTRNLERLNGGLSGGASARGGNSGLNVSTPAREPVADAVTKIVFMGPKKGWGFVKTGCPYYSLQGKNLGLLPGGTLFKYTDVKASSRNPMLVSVLRRGVAWEGPYLLDCTEVAAYEGDPDTVDPETVKNLGDYYLVEGKIAERKTALDEIAYAANPAFKTARETQQAYQTSVAKAAEMAEQSRALTGTRKAKSDEALRALKYEQVRLKSKADAAASAYKAWKTAHPADSDAYGKDAGLQALEQERLALRAKVAVLLPPDEL